MRCVLTPPLMLMVVALHLLLAGTRDQSMFRVYESDNLPKRASPCAGLETGHFQDHSQRLGSPLPCSGTLSALAQLYCSPACSSVPRPRVRFTHTCHTAGKRSGTVIGWLLWASVRVRSCVRVLQ